jgi:hypothetical protein
VLFFGPGEGWLEAVLAGFAGTLLFLALAYGVVAAAIALIERSSPLSRKPRRLRHPELCLYQKLIVRTASPTAHTSPTHST